MTSLLLKTILFVAALVMFVLGRGSWAAGPYGTSIELESPNPVAYGYYGTADVIPDVTGDGKADLAVGAADETAGALTRAGNVYLVNGTTGADLLTLTSPNPETDGGFGRAVDGIADLNSDGKGDVVVGTAETVSAVTHAGRAYVVSGADGSVLRTLVSPNPEANASFGASVLAVPDLNSDSIPDILVGSRDDDITTYTDVGRVYLYSGADGTHLQTLSPISLLDYLKFGITLASIPDITGDSIPDIAVGTFSTDGAYLYSGADLSLIDTLPSSIYSLAGAQDMNGDGKGEILVGDVFYNSLQGRVVVYSGADRSEIRTVVSPTPQNSGLFGSSVTDLGDVNGDGTPDFMVGAPSENALRLRGGRVYVFSGSDGSLIQKLVSPNLQEDGRFGRRVLALPDSNSDGFAEILISTSEESGGFTAAGRSYLFGSGTPPAGGFDDHFDGTALNTDNWSVYTGTVAAPSGSRVTIQNAGIETRRPLGGYDTFIELQGCQYGTVASGEAIDFEVYGYQRYVGFELYESGGSYGDGFFYGLGGLQGFMLNNFFTTVPTTPFSLLFLVNDAGTYVFQNDYYLSGYSSVSNDTEYRFAVVDGNATSVSIDRVTVITGERWGWRPAFSGLNGPYDLGVTGVSMTIDNETIYSNYVSVERINSAPTGLTGVTPLGHHWSLGGMSGRAFTASVTFAYTPEEVAAAGVNENTLTVYRSTDGGSTYTPQTTILDTGLNTATVNGVTQFSLWTLASDPSSIEDWTLR